MTSLVLEYLPSGTTPQDPLTGLQAPTWVLPRGSGPLSSNYLHVQSPFTAGPKSSSDWGRGWGGVQYCAPLPQVAVVLPSCGV